MLRDLFLSDVTRDIPPVVYFHEQDPERLAAEVREYIITGGWPDGHPNQRRVPNGIHEQYVRLLTGVAAELDKPGGPDLPTAWISGFYGSGKSSFAKLLGLALDGVELPDGRSLAKALLARDTSDKRHELHEAWDQLRRKIDPIAVVFDIGGVARDSEQIHAAAVRQVQARLGYCTSEPLVADYELKLERAGDWERFLQAAEQHLGTPWSEVKSRPFAEEDFSLVLCKLFPEHYPDPTSWYASRAGTHSRGLSPGEAVEAIGDMLAFRAPDATLFLVIDEVSQYVLSNKDRVDRLRAFTSELGARLKGKAWLFALGQQKLDEEAGNSFLIWAKDRFPPRLRVHLANTNIRDVVHKRLLQKKPEAIPPLRDAFEAHRSSIKLYAYQGDTITAEDFVETYPMLPGHIDLLLRITSALRTRSSRAQGDDQAIRGLLQLLGELFREQDLASQPMGSLVTLDQIYEVQHTALGTDAQESMRRLLDQCANDTNPLLLRAAKAVALLELIQDTDPTDARLVARCLYDRLDRGNQVPSVTEALEELRRRNLLGYSEKHGYKLQSSAGEEWERERREINVASDALVGAVQDALKYLIATPDRPRLEGRSFPWVALLSDGRGLTDASLLTSRDDAVFTVDFRFLTKVERTESTWITRSAETALRDRLVWVSADTDHAKHIAKEWVRSRLMVRHNEAREASLSPNRKLLLHQERARRDDLEPQVRDAVAKAFHAGQLYFRGRSIAPGDHGATFGPALHSAATRLLPDLFPHFVPIAVQPSELAQLLEPELTGPSPKFLPSGLGILELDAGRYVPSSAGVVPRRILEHLEAENGLAGTTLLAHFGRPPFGYTDNVVKACVAGLLRAGKIKVQPEGGMEITALRDAGVRDLFDKDRTFRRADYFPAGDDDIGFQARARICKFFATHLDHRMDREDHAVADAVSQLFPGVAQRLRATVAQMDKLAKRPETPIAFTKLQAALEQCVAVSRQTKPTVRAVLKHLDVLRDGIQLLDIYDAEITHDAIQHVLAFHVLMKHRFAQLRDAEALTAELEAIGAKIDAHLDTERPWRDIHTLDADLEAVKNAYAEERRQRLAWQGEQADAARAEIKARPGFTTLSGDQSHKVLSPLRGACDSDADAIAPPLVALHDPFLLRLQRAKKEANERLDDLLSADQPIRPVDLGLRNREVRTEADVEALVEEVRRRLLEHVKAGARVRLL